AVFVPQCLRRPRPEPRGRAPAHRAPRSRSSPDLGTSMIPEPAQDHGVRGWGPARQTLRALLARQADLGLSTAAVEAMVCRMSFLCCQAGQEVVPEGGPAGVVQVVVGGVVKIICDSPSSKPITVEMVGAGGILQLDADTCPSGYDLMAVAHTPAL